MYNIYRKVYIHFDYCYSSNNPSLLLSDRVLKEGLIRDSQKAVVKTSDSLDRYIYDYCQNDPYIFWENIFNLESREDFYIYVRTEDYFTILIGHWKSLFKHSEVSFFKFLLKMHVENLKLHSTIFDDQNEHIWKECSHHIADFSSTTLSENDLLFRDHGQDLSEMNYEILLANCLANKEFWPVFEKRFVGHLEKFVLDELKTIKKDFYRSILDNFIYAQKKYSPVNIADELDTLNLQLRAISEFQWFFMPLKTKEDLYSFWEVFSTKEIMDLYKASLGEESSEDFNQLILSGFFQKRYEELLEYDIKKCQGTSFFDNQDKCKINYLLISYLYGLYREEGDLTCFKLQRHF